MEVVLKKIQLRNYRSCVDASFSLQPDLSVLIGPNGSGKTNVLNGLVLLRRLLDFGGSRRFGPDVPTGQCVVKAWFDVDGKLAILTAKVDLYTDESNRDVVARSTQSWYLKDFTGSAKRLGIPLGAGFAFDGGQVYRDDNDDYIVYSNAARMRTAARHMRVALAHGFSLDEQSEPALRVISRIADWVRGITYYSASQFTNPSACPVSIEVESAGATVRRWPDRGGTAARFLFDLYSSHHAPSEGYKAFIDIVGPKGIHLLDKISFKELKTSSVDYTVRVGGQAKERRLEKILVVPQFAIGKNALSPNQLSEGTFKTIALLFYLLTVKSTLLLIEEPEVCIHHGLLASILALMKTESASQQIVVSTHSDFVIDHVEPRSVFMITRSKEGETSVSSLTNSMSGKRLLALREYLETEGTLGEYWKHGALE